MKTKKIVDKIKKIEAILKDNAFSYFYFVFLISIIVFSCTPFEAAWWESLLLIFAVLYFRCSYLQYKLKKLYTKLEEQENES